MSEAGSSPKTIKISTLIEIIAALVVIIGFIFGVANWGDIQQYFWRQRIVGTWQDQSGTQITFDADGNFNSGGLLPVTGVYTFSDGDHLLLQMSGLLSIGGTQIFKADFSGNTMTWLNEAIGSTYIHTKIR